MNNPPARIDSPAARDYNTGKGAIIMADTRRRRLAWLFALVLLMELALLCCACVHADDHECAGHEACAICRYLRLALRGSRALAAAAFALLALAAMRADLRPRSPRFAPVTLFALKVRMND